MYNKSRTGPKMDPCGTPQSDSDKYECQLINDTNWQRSDR